MKIACFSNHSHTNTTVLIDIGLFKMGSPHTDCFTAAMHDFPWEQRRSRGYKSVMLSPEIQREGKEDRLNLKL